MEKLRKAIYTSKERKNHLFNTLQSKVRPKDMPAEFRFRFHRRKFVEGRKKHVQTMFNTRNDKDNSYSYKSSLNKPIRSERSMIQDWENFIFFRNMERQNTTLEKHTLKTYTGILRWYLKNFKLQKEIGYKINCFPDFVLTAKPKEMRMGKGKGSPNRKVSPLRAGSSDLILILKKEILPATVKILVKTLMAKLSFRAKGINISW